MLIMHFKRHYGSFDDVLDEMILYTCVNEEHLLNVVLVPYILKTL